MKIGIHYNELKDLIFIYDDHSLIDVLKCLKVILFKNKMVLMNLYKNNYIINTVYTDSYFDKEYTFLCYIEDLKNLFSIVTEDTILYINDIDTSFMYFFNENSSLKIPILINDDLPNVPSFDEQDEQYKIDLPLYYEQIKNILIKGSNNDISNYLSFLIDNNNMYILNTDNRRIHSILIDNEYHLPNSSFLISCFFIDYIGKYGLSLYITKKSMILKNNRSIIILGEKIVNKDFTKKAFIAIRQINQKEYLNKFTVNKRVFLEELKKHYMFSKDVYMHLKQNNVILYSINDKKANSDIKTNSHSYNIDFNEHQSVLLDIKNFADFIKAHSDQSIDIYLSNDDIYIYSKNNLCSTKRM
jgi:hypothetical protein